MTLFQKKYGVILTSPKQVLSLRIAVSLLAAIIIFSNTGAYSQNAPVRVSGQVTDVSSGETLVGATVKVHG